MKLGKIIIRMLMLNAILFVAAPTFFALNKDHQHGKFLATDYLNKDN